MVLSEIYRRRFHFLASSLLLATLAVFLAFFVLEKVYTSTITFLPPISFSGMPFISGSELSGILGSSSRSVISSDQIQAIVDGEDFGRHMISKFDLVNRYKIRAAEGKITVALRAFRKNMTFTSLENSGIGFTSIYGFSLAIEDRNPDTAKLMCESAYQYLDSVVKTMDSQKARQSAAFLEGYLIKKAHVLDSLQSIMISFRQKNKFIEPVSQQQLSVSYYGEIREQVRNAELQYAAIASIRGQESSEAKAARQYIYELNRQLQEVELNKKPDVILNVNRFSTIAMKYSNLQREIEFQIKSIVLLSQQLEVDRLEEVRTTSPLQIIDFPHVPDYKSKPKRLYVILMVIVGGEALHIAIIAYFFLFREIFNQSGLLQNIRAAGERK